MIEYERGGMRVYRCRHCRGRLPGHVKGLRYCSEMCKKDEAAKRRKENAVTADERAIWRAQKDNWIEPATNGWGVLARMQRTPGKQGNWKHSVWGKTENAAINAAIRFLRSRGEQ